MATKGQRPLLMSKLLQSGSWVNSVDHSANQCPLYLTTKYLGKRGRRQLSKFLLAAGTDATIMDCDGKSSLYWSLRNGDYDLFCFMIDAHNPRCWNALIHLNVEALMAQMSQEMLIFIEKEWYNPPCLSNLCRLVIRNHLLIQFHQRSLFLYVPSLPLPSPLKRFILLDQQPPQEESIPCFMKNVQKHHP